MLQTKVCGNRSNGSGEEDFKGFLTIYAHGGHLGHVTSIILIHFYFLVPMRLHTKFGEKRLRGF